VWVWVWMWVTLPGLPFFPTFLLAPQKLVSSEQ